MKKSPITDPSDNHNLGRYGVRLAALAAATAALAACTPSPGTAAKAAPKPKESSIAADYPDFSKFTDQERTLEGRLEVAAAASAKTILRLMRKPASHAVVDTAYNKKQQKQGLYSINNFATTIAATAGNNGLPAMQIYYNTGVPNGEGTVQIEAEDLKTYDLGIEYKIAGTTAVRLDKAVAEGKSPSITDFEAAINSGDAILSQVTASDPNTPHHLAPYVGFNDNGRIFVANERGVRNLPKANEVSVIDATVDNIYAQTAHVDSLVR